MEYTGFHIFKAMGGLKRELASRGDRHGPVCSVGTLGWAPPNPNIYYTEFGHSGDYKKV